MTQDLTQTSTEAEIAQLTFLMSKSWNRGDARAYGALFGEGSDYVAFDGTRLRGRTANVEHHDRLFRTVLRDTRLVFEGTPSIRLIGDQVAIMHAMGSVLMPWHQQVLPKRRSIQTYVVMRGLDGKWRIEAFHNSRLRPMNLPSGIGLRLILAAMRLRAWLAQAGRSPARS